jgi:hypothetical protein
MCIAARRDNAASYQDSAWQPLSPSLRAKRSNPAYVSEESWIASSPALLAMTVEFEFSH